MDALWKSILELMSQLVIPDWGALVALIPVFLALLFGLWFLRTAQRYATLGPSRRGKSRITPVAPPGIHMPGGSLAPVFGAVGLFLTMFGLVLGGPLAIVGIVALSLSLLYWMREGMRDYDALAHASTLPALIQRTPPPGVHLPGPSFRPILGALGVSSLMFGLVFGGWLLLAGVIALIAVLLGWLRDARLEYVKTVEADMSGHLENIPAPGYPSRLVGGLLVVVVLAGLVQAGILPPRSAPASAGGVGGPTAGPATPGPSLPAGDIHATAKDVTFTAKTLDGPAGRAFTIVLDNQDKGVPHDVSIKDATGKVIFAGKSFPGVAVRVEDVPAIPAGTYTFFCSVHPIPAMTGTLTLK